MQYEYTEDNGSKECRAYRLDEPVEIAAMLRGVYSLSESPDFAVAYIRIDEPFGLDSDWRHLKGHLTKGLDADGFVRKYQSLDIESISVRATFGGISVAVYVLVNESVLRISYPLETAASELARLEQAARRYFS